MDVPDDQIDQDIYWPVRARSCAGLPGHEPLLSPLTQTSCIPRDLCMGVLNIISPNLPTIVQVEITFPGPTTKGHL
jgi:hypothetical protein